jgi:2-polyprenyl-6-methoxyphenol hydroxylase-like FAD-dependent oxidoreductase
VTSGAGIGGLTLALALAPYPDVSIDIYEAATRFEEIGAGLAIWGRGVTALKKLGLVETLRSIAPGTNERKDLLTILWDGSLMARCPTHSCKIRCEKGRSTFRGTVHRRVGSLQ